ncbi:ABC transporter transmembrane domain-containing protein, partial [Pseudomonadota bacterium]
MEPSIYKYIFRYTAKDQILLLLLTAGSLPILYATLEIPKIIVNQAIGGQGMPQQLFGVNIDQIAYLMVLCFIFLGLVALHGGLKYLINVYRGVVGERMLRRFRYELYSRIQRFPLPHFKRTSQGEIIPMITAETEPLGGFIGDSFALPAFQGGMLITYLTFIFNQDVLLGLAAIALYPPQIYLIPKLQKKVNELAKRKVQNVRKLADKVGESISGITEIHANDTTHFERADIGSRLGTIYEIRLEIFKRKYFIKFLNNFLAQLTPFFFFSVGGYFVIKGELSLGALVAVLAAYKDISPPWKELLKFYQIKEDIRIKYAQIIEQFQPSNMFPKKLLDDEVEQPERLGDELVSTRLSYSEDEQVKIVDSISFSFSAREHVAIVGLGGSGKEELGRLLARLLLPSAGSITIDGEDTAHMQESILGRKMAYVGQNAHIFSGTVRDNLYYGLKHRPIAQPQYDAEGTKLRANRIQDALRSGNSTDDIDADWTDYVSVGVEDQLSLADKTVEILKIPEVDQDVYNLGLFGSVDPEKRPRLSKRILEGRYALRDRLQDSSIALLVEPFNENKFNTNMSVAENLLFGTATDVRFDLTHLAVNKQILKVLEEEKLIEDFLEIGHRTAQLMVDIFADVPADSELFEQFSFISAEDLAGFSSLLGRVDANDLGKVSGQDREMLLSLPFK